MYHLGLKFLKWTIIDEIAHKLSGEPIQVGIVAGLFFEGGYRVTEQFCLCKDGSDDGVLVVPFSVVAFMDVERVLHSPSTIYTICGQNLVVVGT